MSELNGHSPSPDGFEFEDLEPKVFPVRIKSRGPDGQPLVKNYVLKSASSGAAVKYRNACSKAARLDGQPGQLRVVGFDGLADTEVLLVQLCTFEVWTKPSGETTHGAVSRGWVEALPPGVLKKLFDKVVEMSPYLSGTGEKLASQVENDEGGDREREGIEAGDTLPKD